MVLQAASGASTTASAMSRSKADARGSIALRPIARRSALFDLHGAHGIGQMNPPKPTRPDAGTAPASMVRPIAPELTKQLCGQSAPNVATVKAHRRRGQDTSGAKAGAISPLDSSARLRAGQAGSPSVRAQALVSAISAESAA